MTEISDRIVVAIRKRPLSSKEISRKEDDIIQIQSENSVIVKEIKQKLDLTKYIEEHSFNFDLAFNQHSTNEEVYTQAVRPIIRAAFQRARVTCFAYGQTGSGKTHTMIGDIERQIPGMYLLAGQDIFSAIETKDYAHLQVFVSFFEIYCGKLYDLLAQRNQIQIREDAKGNVNMINLVEKKALSIQQLMNTIYQGQNIRITASNSSNQESSRSHAILQIHLKSGKNIHGKMSFIDLAGSERGADVQDQNKQTRIDGAEINKSLLALKECIRALDLNKNHTPFRGSKLTLVLKDSLTGNCKTVMIGNVAPNSSSSEHTLNTLRYADRVKELKKPENRQFQGDYIQRELMLARQQKNITRRSYNEDDEDQENIKQYSPLQNGKRQSLLLPLQQSNYFQNQNFQQQSQQIKKGETTLGLHRFNLSSIPPINSTNFSNFGESCNNSGHKRINSASSFKNDFENNRSIPLFTKTLHEPVLFPPQNPYSDLFGDTEYLSSQEQGFRQLNQQAVPHLNNEATPQSKQNKQLTNYSKHSIVEDHKNLIDKIIEVSKNEMEEIQKLEQSNDLQTYLQAINSQLQTKMDYIQRFQQQIIELQQASQHWTFQPTQTSDEKLFQTDF